MTVRKLVISFSLLVISLFVIPLSALAISSNGPVASPSAATNYELRTTSSQLPATVSPTSPLYTDLLVNNIFHTFSCLAVGQSVIGQPCLTYQVTKNAQGMIQGVPVLSQVNLSGGTLGAVTGVIGALYQNPPVRTADYLASMGKDLGLVKEAHAQVVGSGQDVLHPILSLWQASRNIAYVLMIIIFLIIGLMVMFRNRINPQTVITAQAALPGLVVGLIMITFSYFFAGLVADTAFIGTNIVGYYFSTAHNPPLNPPQNLLEDIKNKNVLSIFSPLTRVMRVPDVISAINSVWDDLADPTIGPLDILNTDPQRVLRSLTTLIATQFALPFGGLFGGIGQIVIGAISVAVTQAFPVQIAGFALAFVAMAALIYAMFKLLLRLINSYLTIVFLTITAPFQLLAAALPGRQRLATGWILNMLANVLAFPAVLAVLYFVAFIVGPDKCVKPACPFIVSQLNQTEINTFVPTAQAAGGTTVVSNATFPLLGGFDLGFINLLLAFGALLALPSIPDIIARSIGTLSQTGQLIGQEVGGGFSQGQRYAGQFQQGAGGFVGQAGRLTDQPGTQYYFDPQKGWVSGETRTPGQFTRFGRGFGKATGWIRNRAGRGGGAVT